MMLSFPQIDPVALQIGPIAIRWYALAYLGGIMLGWAYAVRLVRDEKLWPHAKPPATAEQVGDFITWVTLGIILGGRLGYALFYNTSYYLGNPAEILKVWQGGMSFHGGLLGVIFAILLFARRHKLPLGSFADLIACVVPIGLLFGRIANFINGELWGRVSDAPIAMVFPGGGPLPRHPSQLYEAALEGAFLLVLIYTLIRATNALKRSWLVNGVFVAGYGVARTFVEFFREPDAQIGFLSHGLTMGMLLSLPMIITGACMIVMTLRRAAAP